jgi:diguanylate cyclase (GGDEF)-like protein
MGPAGTIAVLLPSVCSIALAGYVLLQRRRIGVLRARIAGSNRTDPLTGLFNRRAFEELLEMELERATRTDRPMSVIVGDIDGFRAVNEQHGHAAGDAALQAIAENALKWKRRIDLAARIGGEEFALLLPETDERGAFIVAERLRRATHRSLASASSARQTAPPPRRRSWAATAPSSTATRSPGCSPRWAGTPARSSSSRP